MVARRERQRRHRQVEALEPQGRVADHDRHRRPDHPGHRQGQRQVQPSSRRCGPPTPPRWRRSPSAQQHLPAHPVSTVIDRMTRANMITAAALRVAPGPSTAGKSHQGGGGHGQPPQRARRTSAQSASSAGATGPPPPPARTRWRRWRPGDVPAPGQQRHEDDDRQHRRHDEVAAQVEVERADRQLVVPADVGLEPGERHGAGHDGRHVRQAAEHEGGQGAQQDREPDR